MIERWKEINAIEPGKEFDRQIAEKVMKWVPHFRNSACYVDADKADEIMEKHHGFIDDFKPSTNIADAWKVVDHVRARGYEVTLWMYEPYRGIRCMIESSNHSPQYSFKGTSAPEVICKAALIMAEIEHEWKEKP